MDSQRGNGRTRRSAGAGLVVCAVIAAGIWAAPSPAGFSSGTYSGDTSQPNNSIQLNVNRKKTKMTVVFFEYDAPPCAEGQYAGLQAKVRDNGKFRALSPADGFYGFVKGRFHGRIADGTARWHFDAQGCDTGVVNWEAEKG